MSSHLSGIWQCPASTGELASTTWTTELLPLFAVQRWIPELSLFDLLASEEGDTCLRTLRVHLHHCPRCVPAALVDDGLPCARGRRLLAEVRRSRYWSRP